MERLLQLLRALGLLKSIQRLGDHDPAITGGRDAAGPAGGRRRGAQADRADAGRASDLPTGNVRDGAVAISRRTTARTCSPTRTQPRALPRRQGLQRNGPAPSAGRAVASAPPFAEYEMRVAPRTFSSGADSAPPNEAGAGQGRQHHPCAGQGRRWSAYCRRRRPRPRPRLPLLGSRRWRLRCAPRPLGLLGATGAAPRRGFGVPQLFLHPPQLGLRLLHALGETARLPHRLLGGSRPASSPPGACAAGSAACAAAAEAASFSSRSRW